MSPQVPPVEQLADALAAWLPTQRWFPGKGSEITGVTALQQSAHGEHGDLRHVVLLVSQPEGDALYQLLLAPAEALPEQVPAAALIGAVDGVVVYDALHDPARASGLVPLLAAGADSGPVRFRHVEGATIVEGAHPRVLGVEQSNTSVVFGTRMILKVFRRVRPGTNPDLEVTLALARAGSQHVASPLAWAETDVDGEPTTLAILQEFLSTASEGWELAKASVRDLLAEADLHAHEVGGDFASEAHRLGATTAEVHADLARVLPTERWGPEQLAAEVAGMQRRLEAAVAVVPELGALAPALSSAYEALVRRTSPLTAQRIHGDLHLGQALRTTTGWVLLDFEGEPAKTLAERRALRPVHQDVTGMLRSFDYASRQLLTEPTSGSQRTYRAIEWATRNRDAFCEGYAKVAGSDPREEQVLMRAYETDKAVYEVVYEARNRPTWLPVPMSAVRRLAEAAETRS